TDGQRQPGHEGEGSIARGEQPCDRGRDEGHHQDHRTRRDQPARHEVEPGPLRRRDARNHPHGPPPRGDVDHAACARRVRSGFAAPWRMATGSSGPAPAVVKAKKWNPPCTHASPATPATPTTMATRAKSTTGTWMRSSTPASARSPIATSEMPAA